MEKLKSIEISLDHLEHGLALFIDERKANSLFIVEDAIENNEAHHQLVEGCFYDYAFSNPKYYFEKDQIIQPHSRNKHVGTIIPNVFVGTLSIPINKGRHELGVVKLEVQSIKTGYREDYRDMLEMITEKCTDLLMHANAPASHYFETDYSKGNETLYQKFAFIKSIISTSEFLESIQRIVSAPVTKWKDAAQFKDIRNLKRFKNATIKEFVKGSKRTPLPKGHYLKAHGLNTVPTQVNAIQKIDSVDTPENRFVKHALNVFLKFCLDINRAAIMGSKLDRESTQLVKKIESYLHHAIFKDISRPETLKINSPILQRKVGYREILRVWLMFDLAAKLIWKGGDDIYSIGKKDMATLYEYWLFFKLLDLFESIFEIEPKAISRLIKKTKNGLNLQIKQGEHTALQGVYNTGTRKLNIRFNYNRSFSGGKEYPESGSWTTTMRPDYTLSFWPEGITEHKAEITELIVHIHFEAKYKIDKLTDVLEQEKQDNLDVEKQDQRKGIYKNADLLKIHAYKDAIRRTGGAYILYPGTMSLSKKGFHEILPGLGAFSVKPSKKDSGISALEAFIYEVITHFEDRASQREKLAYNVYKIHKNPPSKLKTIVPQAFGGNRDLIPDDTFVLVGYYKSKAHYGWIQSKKLYNFRVSSFINKETVAAKYLLLHGAGDKTTNKIWKIVSKGPKVYSKQDLVDKGYKDSSSDNYTYLVIALEALDISDFKDYNWKFKDLPNYATGRASAMPYTCNLTELLQTQEK